MRLLAIDARNFPEDEIMLDLELLHTSNTDANADFLMSLLNLALTYMEVARVTRIEETARRNRADARRAYETVLFFLQKLALSAEQEKEVDSGLAVLEARLEAVGRALGGAVVTGRAA